MRWDEFEKELDAIPGVRESFDLQYPYHAVSVALASVRADLDMTQTEFGLLVGVPQSTVARLESGKQNPSVGMLQRIAKSTGTELVVEFRVQKIEGSRVVRKRAETSHSNEPAGSERIAASNRHR